MIHRTRCPICLFPVLVLLLANSLVPTPGHADDNYDKQVAAATLVQAGQPAPDFTCQVTDGRTLSLSALRGKVVVLHFFSTTVPASVLQMRELETDIAQKVKARDDLLIIGLGRGHTREELVQVGGENRLSFPLAPDPDANLFGRYFTKFVPRTVVIRRDGTLASLTSGYNQFTGTVKLQQVLDRELARPR